MPDGDPNGFHVITVFNACFTRSDRMIEVSPTKSNVKIADECLHNRTLNLKKDCSL